MSMTEEQIYMAAGDYMESACQQFKNEAELLQFITAVAGLSLSVMESLGGEEHLKQFVADATGPNRLKVDAVVGDVQ